MSGEYSDRFAYLEQAAAPFLYGADDYGHTNEPTPECSDPSEECCDKPDCDEPICTEPACVDSCASHCGSTCDGVYDCGDACPPTVCEGNPQCLDNGPPCFDAACVRLDLNGATITPSDTPSDSPTTDAAPTVDNSALTQQMQITQDFDSNTHLADLNAFAGAMFTGMGGQLDSMQFNMFPPNPEFLPYASDMSLGDNYTHLKQDHMAFDQNFELPTNTSAGHAENFPSFTQMPSSMDTTPNMPEHSLMLLQQLALNDSLRQPQSNIFQTDASALQISHSGRAFHDEADENASSMTIRPSPVPAQFTMAAPADGYTMPTTSEPSGRDLTSTATDRPAITVTATLNNMMPTTDMLPKSSPTNTASVTESSYTLTDSSHMEAADNSDWYFCAWVYPDGSSCEFQSSGTLEMHNHLVQMHSHDTLHGGSNETGYICRWRGCHRLEQNKAFCSKNKLESHFLSHSLYKPHVCELCGSAFAREPSLVRHRLFHSQNKQFKCEWPGCGKHFYDKSQLKTHQRIHTGEKPCRCPECGHVSADSTNMSKHKKIHGIREHKCPFDGCHSKPFARSDGLKRHMKTCRAARKFGVPPNTSPTREQLARAQRSRERRSGLQSPESMQQHHLMMMDMQTPIDPEWFNDIGSNPL